MKSLPLLFLFLIILLGSCDDDNALAVEKVENENLTFYFEKANNESLDFQNRRNAADSIRKIIISQPNDSLNRKNYFKLANRYFNMSAMDDYKATTERIVVNSKEAKDSSSLGKAYSYLGDYYGSKFDSEKAYLNYFNAEKIYLKLNDNPKIAKTLLNKAVIQFNEKDFVGSEKSAINALEILKKTNSDELTYEANNVLGVIYHELSEFDKAIQYHNAALLILKKQNVPSEFQSIATSLNNIGAVYQKSKEYGKALKYYKESLQSENILRDKPVLYAALIDNIAYSEFKLKNYEFLPELFYQALDLRDSLKLYPGVASSKLNLSEFYESQKNIPLSQKFAKEAYSLAKEKKLSNEVLLSLKQLSKVDPQNSSFYSSNYIRINDSLQLSERKIRNKLARIEFETDELIVQKDKLVEQKQSLIYLGFALIVVGIFIYVVRTQKAKNRELLLLQAQQAANEEIYQLMITQQEKLEEARLQEQKKIGRELHDGILGQIFGTRMDLSNLNSSINKEDIAKRSVFINSLHSLESQVRYISHELTDEKTIIYNNFVLMVTNFIENQKQQHHTIIDLIFDKEIDWNAVDNFIKINLYRVMQESFQNINKYANASKVVLHFKLIKTIIELQIEDNGDGFDSKKKKKGIGLKNMMSRMESLNGSFQIDSKINSGTKLVFQVPKNKPQ